MSVKQEEEITSAFDKAFNDLFKLRPSERRKILLEKLDYLVKHNEIAVEYHLV